MELQPGHELRWTVLEPAKQEPHLSGKPVFVGHTEQRDGEILDLGLCGVHRYGLLAVWLADSDRRRDARDLAGE